jgi:hypothetical protein
MQAPGTETPARWPLAAACLCAALIPLQPVFVLPDGSPLRFAAADAVAPFVFLAAILRPRRRLPFGLAATALAIPIVATLSTLLAANERPISMYSIGKTGGLFYLAALCLALVRCTEPADVPKIARALAAGAFWSAVIGLIGFAAYLGGVTTSLISGERLCSTMTGDPNIYGSLVAIGLLISATDRAASPAARIVRSVVLGLALLAAGSRSAVLGAFAAFATYIAVRARDPLVATARNTYLLLAAALLVTVVLTTDLGSAVAGRIWEHHWRDFTVASRLDLYRRALEQFEDNPIMGLGVGGFRELNSFEMGGDVAGYVVHDTYLWALVDLGIAGGLLVVGLIAGGLWRCVRAARGRPAVEGAAVVAAGLAAMAVFNLFIDGFYQRHFWVLMACAIAVPIYRPVRRVVTAGRPGTARAAA